MEELRAHLRSETYENWVKCTLGLKVTKLSIDDYVLERFNLCINGGEMFTADNVRHLKRYRLDNWIVPNVNWTGNEWVYRQNFCIDCSKVFDAIINLHTEGDRRGLNWKNSRALTSETDEWSIAKVFMSQGNEDNKGPEDTDIAAYIYMMSHCTLFSKHMDSEPTDKPILTKMKEVRNTLFHSAQYNVATEDMKCYVNGMIEFVKRASEDPNLKPETRHNIKSGISKLEQIKGRKLTLSMYEEAYEFMRDGMIQDLLKKICKGDTQKLKAILKIIADIGGDLARLQNLKRYEEDTAKFMKQIRKLKEETKEQEKCMLHFSKCLNEIKMSVSIFLDSCKAESQALRKRVTTAMTNYYFKQKYQIEAECLIVIFFVTLSMAIILRICVWIESIFQINQV